MNRIRLYIMTASLMLMLAPMAALAADGAWFDLEGCSMCKNMSSEKGLMENMMWENHKTDAGMLSVTVVAEGYEKSFTRAMENMKKTGEKMWAGEKLPLCGFCESYGSLMMAGAKSENIRTKAGEISLLTATDPTVVAKIHAHAQRTIDEYETMMKAEHAHEGHDHHGQGHKHDTDS